MTALLDALALTALKPPPGAAAAYRAELTHDWTQGRTLFGGLLAGLAAKAAALGVGPERAVRSLDVAFVGPISAGPADLVVRVLGEGRSITQLSVEVNRDDVLATRVHVVAGASRASDLRVPGAGPVRKPPESAVPAESGIELPYIEGVLPTFAQHVEYRWCGPAFPFTGAPPEGARLEGWCRWRSPGEADVDDATNLGAFVAMLDVWPPSVLTVVTGPTPASTVRWAIHLLDAVPAGAAHRWYWYECDTVAYAHGYATSKDTFFEDDVPIAWTEQLMAVYDRPA